MESCIRHARRHPCVCLSVCMRLRACILSRVYGYKCMSMLGTCCIHVYIYINVPDFSYIYLLTSKCDVFVVHAVAHA